jgi:hypothetical protein
MWKILLDSGESPRPVIQGNMLDKALNSTDISKYYNDFRSSAYPWNKKKQEKIL